MEPNIQEGHVISIFQLLGSVLTIGSICAFVAIVVLLAAGLRTRVKGLDFSAFVWWIRAIALWIFMFGFVSFAAVPACAFAKLGCDGPGTSLVLFRIFTAAFFRLMIASGISLVGLTASLILGPPRK